MISLRRTFQPISCTNKRTCCSAALQP